MYFLVELERRGVDSVVSSVIERGGVNERDEGGGGETLLHGLVIGAVRGSIDDNQVAEAIQNLLGAGADASLTDGIGKNAFVAGCEELVTNPKAKGGFQALETLVDIVDSTSSDGMGRSAGHWLSQACGGRFGGFAVSLLRRAIPNTECANMTTSSGATPLHWLLDVRNVDELDPAAFSAAVTFLQEAGAKPLASNSDGKIPLDILTPAIEEKCPEAASMLRSATKRATDEADTKTPIAGVKVQRRAGGMTRGTRRVRGRGGAAGPRPKITINLKK